MKYFKNEAVRLPNKPETYSKLGKSRECENNIMKQMNMKAIVAVAAIGMSVCGFAAGGTTVSILPLGGAGGVFVSAFRWSAA